MIGGCAAHGEVCEGLERPTRRRGRGGRRGLPTPHGDFGGFEGWQGRLQEVLHGLDVRESGVVDAEVGESERDGGG